MKKVLPQAENDTLLATLKKRFEKHMNRHEGLNWTDVEAKLKANPEKLVTLYEMEETGGEPDIVGFDTATGEYFFFDCSPETPKGRRSLCYDLEAWESRKEYKPKSSAIEMAEEMGVELLTEFQYIDLQKLGSFDTKTSSWLATPEAIRKLGGAIFGDWRFGRVFNYHNGAETYYSARGFRGALRV